ncbi:BTAD domain-containing putative transcriptional regulator [Actinophytocola sp.]|uniref:AfsR/SARP family transcriptional regulator n=1 Tax=Actinophytocola sp. TaxID=1872138 RepID=UPI00389997D0
MEFRLLGDIEARLDGQPIALGYARLRCLLAVLLVEANRTVAVDDLVERVWGHNHPRRPRGAVQHGITMLRKALTPLRDVEIAWRSTGYHLTVDPATVDVHHFQDLLGQARTTRDDARAADLLERALELWRGEPFGTLDTPWVNTVRTTLLGHRHAAELDLTDIRLRRGQHGALVAELSAQAADNPLDERLAGQYLLALYRSGHQADALHHYQELRERLADNLGADPSPPLRTLHQRILAADPALDLPVRPVMPRQLPAPPRSFTGRTDELARLTKAVGEHAIVSVGGIGGIGKTWLALHWAHEHLDRFPDGQLYVNLRGFDPSGQPLSPDTAIRGLLAGLGVDTAALPADPEALAGTYRSVLAGKQILLLLDNAADLAQVTPLLPGGPTCTVIVTSRRQLTGLVAAHGAVPLALDVLSAAEATELLARRLGAERVDGEPAAVAGIVASCGGLPLALGVVAARAATHPRLPLATLVAELTDAQLDALGGGDLSSDVRSVLSWSIRGLDDEAVRVFGLLGAAPGPDIGLPAAAALAGLPVARTRAALRRLDDAYLVQEHVPGRFRMHDLIRLFAAERSTEDEPLRRLVDFLLRTAYAGERRLYPYRPPIDVDPLPVGDAAAWFDAEHPCLLAAQELAAARGWQREVWQLAWALDTYHRRRGFLRDQIVVWTAALGTDDEAVRARAHRVLGHTHTYLGEPTDAGGHLRQALALAEQQGDLAGQAETQRCLAWTWVFRGDDRRALEHATTALELCRATDRALLDGAPELNMVGWLQAKLGAHDEARRHCAAALAIHRKHHNREGEAEALGSLGFLELQVGDHDQALTHYRQAIAVCRELNHTRGQAELLGRMGDVLLDAGRPNEAREYLREALDLHRSQHNVVDVERIQGVLATLTQRDLGPDFGPG